MPPPVKCPKCHHEFVPERRNSTLRSAVLDVRDVPIRDDAPMCVCGHVRVLHEDKGDGPCTLCGMVSCDRFVEALK